MLLGRLGDPRRLAEHYPADAGPLPQLLVELPLGGRGHCRAGVLGHRQGGVRATRGNLGTRPGGGDLGLQLLDPGGRGDVLRGGLERLAQRPHERPGLRPEPARGVRPHPGRQPAQLGQRRWHFGPEQPGGRGVVGEPGLEPDVEPVRPELGRQHCPPAVLDALEEPADHQLRQLQLPLVEPRQQVVHLRLLDGELQQCLEVADVFAVGLVDQPHVRVERDVGVEERRGQVRPHRPAASPLVLPGVLVGRNPLQGQRHVVLQVHQEDGGLAPAGDRLDRIDPVRTRLEGLPLVVGQERLPELLVPADRQ